MAATKNQDEELRDREGLSPKQNAFLDALELLGTMHAAATASGVGERTAYRWKAENDRFAEEFAISNSVAGELLRAEAFRRAKDGDRKLKFHNGQMIMVPVFDEHGKMKIGADGEPVMVPYTEHEKSDVLLIFLLKGKFPAEYRERYDVNNNHSGGIDASGVLVVQAPCESVEEWEQQAQQGEQSEEEN